MSKKNQYQDIWNTITCVSIVMLITNYNQLNAREQKLQVANER
jgi:hypothetical protein